tara:strand:- start:11378 stop:11995 length:618 start_codon:yes stop_codon:yes gene_type:complete
MVRTKSTMIPLGTSLPSFDLSIVQGTPLSDSYGKHLTTINSQMLIQKPLLLMIICAHCPFVKHIEPAITALEADFGEMIQMIAIASNSLITHPQDGPEFLSKQACSQGWGFPYLLDSNQSLAKDLKAACTPDFFLFSPSSQGNQKLEYRGQLDQSRPGNDIPVSGEDLRAAIEIVLQSKKIEFDQKPSIGCNIKWHPGQEPSWFG